MRYLLLLSPILLIPALSWSIVMCPDGSYVGGDICRMAPDGSYVGGQPRIAPDGTYVGEIKSVPVTGNDYSLFQITPAARPNIVIVNPAKRDRYDEFLDSDTSFKITPSQR